MDNEKSNGQNTKGSIFQCLNLHESKRKNIFQWLAQARCRHSVQVSDIINGHPTRRQSYD